MGTQPKNQSVVAVSSEDYKKYGCPDCSNTEGYSKIRVGNTVLWECDACNRNYLVIFNGAPVSDIEIGGEFPSVQPHPRAGRK